MTMKVVVTGAAGYIGQQVVHELLNWKSDIEVIALDRRELEACPRLDSRICDIFSADFDLLETLGFVPDALIHLAWRDGFVHSSPAHMQDLSAHFNFLTQAIKQGCPRVAVMGTMHEVGYWEGAIDQTSPCNPSSLYGLAKHALRRSLELEIGQLVNSGELKAAPAFYWLRAFYITGNDAASQSIFGKIMRADKEGKTSFPFTTGRNRYDFISVGELAHQIVACLMQDEVTGIINCCSGNPLSLAEAVEAFIAKHQLKIRLEYGAYPDRAYDSPGVWGDASRIRQILAKLEGE